MPVDVNGFLQKMNYNYAPNYALDVDDSADLSKYLPESLTPLSSSAKLVAPIEDVEDDEEAMEGRKLDFDKVESEEFTTKAKRKHTPRPTLSSNKRKKGSEFQMPRSLNADVTPMRRSARLSKTPQSLRRKMEEMLL